MRIAPELVVRTIIIALGVLFLHGIIGALFDFEVPGLAWLMAASALWIPMTIGLYSRAAEVTFRPWRKLDRRQKLRRWAGAVWTTPAIMFFPLWLALPYEPSLLIEYWELYVLFFGVPIVAAAGLYFYSARVDSSS